MSLVNDMLKDLDRRKRLPGSAVSSYSRGDEESPGSSTRLRTAAFIAVGLLAGVVATYMFFDSTGQSIPVTADTSNQLPAPASSDASDVVPEAGDQQGQGADPVTEQTVSVVLVENSASGFVLNVVSEEAFSFEIVSRNNFGITIGLQGVTANANSVPDLGGFSLLESDDGLNLILEQNQRTDYMVHEQEADSAMPGMTLVVEAILRNDRQQLSSTDSSESLDPATNQASANQADSTPATENTDIAGEDGASEEEADIAQAQVANESSANADESLPATGEGAASIKTLRELTLEEQDINISQKATRDIQRGQLMVAYQNLLTFIGANPEAHRSRETLATLLFAQQELQQAEAIVDQGLAIAPNYAAYKKIKARLLIQQNMAVDAIRLLRNLPPRLQNDPEYYELLASSYRQINEHESAIEIYQDLIRLDSQQARWWAGMGISHEALGNIDRAVASYQAALQTPSLEPALRQYSQSRIRFLGN